MLGVVKLVPVPRLVPPVEAAYQSAVDPDGGVAERVTVPVPQRLLGVPVGAAGMVGCAFITTLVDAGEAHPLVPVTVKV